MAAARRQNGGSASRSLGGGWFLGFLGALIYYLHTHSGNLWLVIIAVGKALVWPAFLVYHLLGVHG